MAKSTAEKYPKLNSKVQQLEALAKQRLGVAGGRYGIYDYAALVLRTYRSWDKEGNVTKFIERIRKLRPVRAREDSHPFLQILSATSGLSAKACSKWVGTPFAKGGRGKDCTGETSRIRSEASREV